VPVRAAELEVHWWHLHRAHQYDSQQHDSLQHESHEHDSQQHDGHRQGQAATRDELEQAVVDLYSHVYGAEPETVRPAAQNRVEAMDLSDRWVAAGRDRADPLLAAERRALVASYSALFDAVSRAPA
jgi:hypothetical protein